VRRDLGKHFAAALKSNRTVALTLDDKQQGRFIRIDQLPWAERQPAGLAQGTGFPRVAKPPSLYGQGRQHRDAVSGL
jgi:hypothetical protein